MLNKTQLLEAMRRERAEWDALLDGIGEARLDQAELSHGWTAKDVAAHVTAYEAWLVDWLEAALRGSLVAPSVVNDPDEDARNARLHEQNRERPAAEVLVEAAATFEHLLRLVEALPEEDLVEPVRTEWFVKPFYGSAKPLSDCLAEDTFEHYQQHAADLRRWLKANGRARRS